MQHFINTADQQPFAFEDDVQVVETDGVYSFFTTDGVLLDALPTTLQPSEPPPPYVPPPPTAADVLAQRDALKAIATGMIDPLNDAVELEVATPAEVAALKAWKLYRLALVRIDQQSGFPTAVVWPDAPT